MTSQGVDMSLGNVQDWNNLQDLFKEANKASSDARRLANGFIRDYYTGQYSDFYRVRFRPESR